MLKGALLAKKNTTSVTAKVNTNIVDKTPKDLRHRFLSLQNYRLMSAVLRFATDYAQGILRVNDLIRMKCDDLKIVELIDPAYCQGECRKKFINAKFLYCVIDNAIVTFDEGDKWNKFKLVCNSCSNNFAFNDQYDVIQLYPHVSLDDVERLCASGFLTKYIFPIKLDYTETTTEIQVPGYHDFYKIFKTIVKEKKSYEQITKIQLRTYGRDLFTETDNDCIIRNGLDTYGEHVYNFEFYPRESNMLNFLKIYKDTKPLTFFYRITKRIYTGEFDYFVYFPIKCYRFCNLCKSSKLYNKNPVLYCSQCGFTDSFFFKNSLFMANVVYIKDCVKVKTLKPKRILYYDLTAYKNIMKN
ncbi:me53 [Alphabaculovirus alterspexiguae]|uniref:Me53 n=1 Tax=Spodoptera exigua multiple nucleopolyhedrovirus TaxID=10454 RepID=A0A3G2JTV2_9ABAC|nr:me53 [Spodoptera exigua multiple nucleopolyhedrovirus]AYN44966.1 me53 [Spodoptera exigua multiple nucleopolyhedrovirus]